MSNLIKFRFPITNIKVLKNNVRYFSTHKPATNITDVPVTEKKETPRLLELRKKLREKTPITKLEEHSVHPFAEKQPLVPWPNNTNPHTGEIGGPAGPEPTRYGDWERKGRVSDF